MKKKILLISSIIIALAILALVFTLLLPKACSPASSEPESTSPTTTEATMLPGYYDDTKAPETETTQDKQSNNSDASEMTYSSENTEEITHSTQQDPTEETSDATTQPTTQLPSDGTPDFTLPTLPEQDIIGPKPPINPDDIPIPSDPVEKPTTPTPTEKPSTPQTKPTESASQPAIPTEKPSVPQINPTEKPTTPQVTPTETPTIPTTAKPTEKPTEPVTSPPPVDYTGRLKFTHYGRYTGKFVEDGTDEYVKNVAIVLITNISNEHLEYAVVTFDISGTPAAFVVTGLAPGESAWVLENNRLQIESSAVFTHVDDIASFKADNTSQSKDIKVTLRDGQLTVENKSGTKLSGVYIYYKQVHTDGNFLGGITYRVPIGDLDKGETAHAIAIHCNPKTCRVVRIDWEN